MARRARRAVETVEFDADETAGVVARMDQLAVAADGWINLVPETPDDAEDEPSGSFFSVLFGTVHATASLCTWMPAKPGLRAGGEEAVGIVHPRGWGAIDHLASAGVAVPGGWRVAEDHPRRGLIVHPGQRSTHGEVVAWMLRAGAALSAVPLTGHWRARVYLPLVRSTTS